SGAVKWCGKLVIPAPGAGLPEGQTMPAHRSHKVVLFLPPYAGKILGPPLGLLSLAGSLRAAGYQPRVIDGALHGDNQSIISDEIRDCACFGVSLLTGPMIRDAIEIASMVRRLRPELP